MITAAACRRRQPFSARTAPTALGAVLLVMALLLQALTASAAPGDTSLQVRRVTPSGDDVAPGRQLLLEFDRPMVPLGVMDRRGDQLPIRIDPPLNCHWRWLDPHSLACNLDEKDALQPATPYRLTLSPGLTALDGATLAEPFTHQFATVRPRLGETWFKTWLSPRLPQTVLRTNLAVHQESLAAHLFYQAGGRRIAALVEPDPDYGAAAGNMVWLITPAADLPGGSVSRLQIKPGLRSLQGSLAGSESRTIATLQTIPEPRLLGLSCSSKNNKAITLALGQAAGEQRCLPSAGVSLLFSAPVLAEELRHGITFHPELINTSASDHPWEQVPSYSRLFEPYDKGKRYAIELPEAVLKPNTTYRLRLMASAVRDEFGRPLEADADMSFATDHRNPDFALLKNLPVLEKNLDSDAHVWAVNLRQLQLSYDRIDAAGNKVAATTTITPQGPEDTSIAVPLTLRTLLGKNSGVVQGRFATVPQVADKGPDDSWFFAQVTPFHVHLKLGHHNSLAWVTDLHSGLPVAEVSVQVIKSTFAEFGNPVDPLAGTITDTSGIAILPGTTVLDPKLHHVYTGDDEEKNLFLVCRKGEDMAVLPLRYDYRAAAEGANRQYIADWLRPLHGHIKVWGATAQGIYKAGDTVQYKIFVRDQDNLRLIPPPGAAAVPQKEDGTAATAPTYSLKVFDPMGKVVHEQNTITLSPFGAFHGEVPLAAGGAVGWHRFVVGASFHTEEWEAMRVLVSDFTPAPFKVATDLSGDRFQQGDQVRVNSSAKLHAGGPYGGASTRQTATLETKTLSADDPRLQGFHFDSRIASPEQAKEVEILNEHQGQLDDQGQLEHTFAIAESPILYGQLTVESAVQDDRGKTIAQRGSAAYFGRDRFVGLFQGDWTLQENRPATLRVAVVDDHGQLLTGIPFSVRTEEKETHAARVKGAGDGYHHQYEHRWRTVEELQGVSAGEPLEMIFTPKRSGHFRLTATIADSRDRSHSTTLERWVTGSGRVLWEAPPGNLLSVYPEKNTYAVGDTARFLVHNPFPGAQALITVERLGVIDRWQRVLNNSSEIIEVPIRADYLPGFYLSVLVTSPRVEQAPGPQGEDLGKPTYRLGYVKVPVRDPHKELTVAITPRQKSYKPGETVEIDMAVAPRSPFDSPAPPLEVAVAVVDEAVFDLLKGGRKRYDPYENFYALEELDLSNYNLLMQLVGRENLALKGAAAAGDGGDFSLRSIFKYVAHWNPAVRPDQNGKASIRFALPDNLTAWRVLAMAVSPGDRMGLGEATFTVNQRTEIRPILPNRLLAGDSFSAGYTLVNRTDQTRTLTIGFRAEGPLQPSQATPAESSTEVTLAPFQRQVVRFPLTTKGVGELRLVVTASDAIDRDAMESRLSVAENVRPLTAAVFGTVEGEKAVQAITFPEEMSTAGGSLQLSLSPTALGSISGAFTYLKDYPYGCWEQKLSRAMMAASYDPLARYMRGDFSWPESGETVRLTLAEAATFQAPNGGMTYFQAQDQWVSPYLSAFTALSFNHLQLLGYQPPRVIEEKLHQYLERLLRQDTVPQEYSRSMTATVRAVTLAALAEKGKLGVNDVLRFHSQVRAMSLFGRAFYLRALLATGASPEKTREVLDSLLAQADQSANSAVFSEALDPGHAALHGSTVRDTAAILVSLLAWLDGHRDDISVRDLAMRVQNGLTLARRGKAHWASTQENLFVVQAMVEYARLFEEGEPQLEIAATLDREVLGQGRFSAYNDAPLILTRPIAAGEAGRSAEMELTRSGEGRLYYGARLTYLPPGNNRPAVNAGIEVQREYSVKRGQGWQLVDQNTVLTTGEVVRVDLYVTLPAERYFVVVDDPVPGGLEPVNKELATAATQEEDNDAAPGSIRHQSSSWQESRGGRHGFSHQELRHHAARFYAERLAAGRYHLQYTAQAIAPGQFQVPPLHAEEMYAPDVYGDSLPARVTIKAAP
jgi:alpha-2-macroglobulin